MIKGIAIGFFCFALFLSHIFIFHIYNIKRRFFIMFQVFLYALLIYAAFFFLIPGNQIREFITSFIPLTLFSFVNGAFLHLFLCYFYLHLIQVIDRSLSTRIMLEIENSPKKRLTLGDIKKLYSIDKKVSDELEDLVIMGRLNKESNFYSITPKGKIHMRIFQFIRDYLRLRRS